MRPAPDKHSEVVYRRMPVPGSPGSTEHRRGYAPAIAPLVIGFLLLLAVILALGVRSTSKMNDVASNARILTLGYSTHLSKLLDLKLKLINLNNEARLRDSREGRRELEPPLNLRMDKARDDVREVYDNLGAAPMNVKAEDWENFKQHLQSYIEVTQDRRLYNQKGFDKFKNVEDDLKVLIPAFTFIGAAPRLS